MKNKDRIEKAQKGIYDELKRIDESVMEYSGLKKPNKMHVHELRYILKKLRMLPVSSVTWDEE